LQIDVPLTLLDTHFLDSSLKGFSLKVGHAGQRREIKRIKKWTKDSLAHFAYLTDSFPYNSVSWAPPAVFWWRKTLFSIYPKDSWVTEQI